MNNKITRLPDGTGVLPGVKLGVSATMSKDDPSWSVAMEAFEQIDRLVIEAQAKSKKPVRAEVCRRIANAIYNLSVAALVVKQQKRNFSDVRLQRQVDIANKKRADHKPFAKWRDIDIYDASKGQSTDILLGYADAGQTNPD